MIEWLLILFLFLVGVRLSAFFSGIETAFYRASKLRLNIDAQTGDTRSRWILKYVSDPSSFVATILIGNNLANYVTTFAIGLGAMEALGEVSEVMEVSITVLISPVIFIFGELLPKTIHYQVPLLMLRRYFSIFYVIHIFLLPFSWPMMVLTKLFQQIGGGQPRTMERILGRRPLANVIGQGREEGLLTEVQHSLVQGVFDSANRTLNSLVIPQDVAFFFEGELTSQNLLQHAKDYGLIDVPIVSHESDEQSSGHCSGEYYRVCDLLLSRGSIQELAEPMPELEMHTSRLEALIQLQESNADVALVTEQGELRGVLRRNTLIESLYQGGLSPSSATV